jgi:peptide/nickel transport system permease protein
MAATIQASPNAPDDPSRSSAPAKSEGLWHAAFRKLAGDSAAMFAAAIFAIIVLLCVLAPVYADLIAHTDPFHSNINR